jgi:hypothetical protein
VLSRGGDAGLSLVHHSRYSALAENRAPSPAGACAEAGVLVARNTTARARTTRSIAECCLVAGLMVIVW